MSAKPFDFRWFVLSRVRRAGIEPMARLLAGDYEALERLREVAGEQLLLRDVLRKADELRYQATLDVMHAFLARQG